MGKKKRNLTSGYNMSNRRNSVFSFDSFEITRREIIASITIISILLIIGIMISDKIKQNMIAKSDTYNKAIKINDDTEQFQYGMNTSVGNAFVYGDLVAVDTVSYPELDGEYMYVRKEEKHKERHEEEVEVEDDDGKKHKETRVWYEWETANTDSVHAKEIQFCDVVFPYSKIKLPGARLVDTQRGKDVWSWKSFEYVDVKFEYYAVDLSYKGTIFTDLRNGTISNGTTFYNGKTIDETIKKLTSSGGLILFWVCWSFGIILCVFLFYYADNKWLEK